jgi:hypothetical protein
MFNPKDMRSAHWKGDFAWALVAAASNYENLPSVTDLTEHAHNKD